MLSFVFLFLKCFNLDSSFVQILSNIMSIIFTEYPKSNFLKFVKVSMMVVCALKIPQKNHVNKAELDKKGKNRDNRIR